MFWVVWMGWDWVVSLGGLLLSWVLVAYDGGSLFGLLGRPNPIHQRVRDRGPIYRGHGQIEPCMAFDRYDARRRPTRSRSTHPHRKQGSNGRWQRRKASNGRRACRCRSDHPTQARARAPLLFIFGPLLQVSALKLSTPTTIFSTIGPNSIPHPSNRRGRQPGDPASRACA